MKLLLSLCLLLLSNYCFANVNDIIRPNFYYSVSWSNIMCFKAPCSQYTIFALNNPANSKPIYKINIPSELKSYEKYLIGDESNSVIIYGHTSPNTEYPTEANDLNIVRAFKRLPLGNNVTSTDQFYLFTNTDINCIKAPCDNIAAILANYYSQVKHVNTIKQPYETNVGPFFDSAWLNAKTVRSDDNGLIGQGTINENNQVIISNSYVRLPDPSSKCPTLPMFKCAANNIVTYTRDENRCLANPKCTLAAMCKLSIPVCPSGYTLDSWKAVPGCPDFKCDASFLMKTH